MMPASYDGSQMARIGHFALQVHDGDVNSTALQAVTEFTREQQRLEAELMKERFAAAEISSDIQVENLGVEADRLKAAIETLDPDATRTSWSFEAVRQTVTDAKRTWESKKRLFGGKPQELYHDVMCNLEAHSQLFEIVPSSNTYVSIVAGAIKCLVKASSNHRDTVNQLTKALKDINDEANACEADQTLAISEAMSYAVAKFYVHVFIFYADAVRWYRSGSFWKTGKALQSEFSKRFNHQLERIKELSHQIQRVRENASAAEIRFGRLQVGFAADDLRAGLDGIARQNAELARQLMLIRHEQQDRTEMMRQLADEREQRLISDQLWLELGRQGSALLVENDNHHSLVRVISQNVSPATSVRPGSNSGLNVVMPGVVADMMSEVETSRILLESAEPALSTKLQLTWAALTKKLEDARTPSCTGCEIPDIEIDHLIGLDQRILMGLKDWITATKSKLLYLEGAHGQTLPQPVSLAALRLVQSASDMQLPMISYFCSTDIKSDPDSVNTPSAQCAALTELALSLALQIAGQLPPLDPAPEALWALLSALESSKSNKSEIAINLLKMIFDESPPYLLCVIDSFETIADENPDAIRLLDAVQAALEAAEAEHKTLKVLLTCSNRCVDLLSRLEDDQIVLLESSTSVGKAPIDLAFDDELCA